MAELRARDELAVQYRAATLDHEQSGEEFPRGAAAALGWLSGAILRAPISGLTSSGQVTAADVYREEDYARDVVYGQQPLDGQELPPLPQDYAVGVEHALMWARAEANTPAPFDDLAQADD